MSKRKIYILWSLRILVFILFLLSAIAKLVPVWAFEKQLVDLQLFTWCQAPYFARFIIAVEIAIGFAILQNNLIKRLVIPATILLLLAFCIHLSIQIYQFGAMNGNCGCFGQLIPMTPLEALIKNILTIAILIYLYKNVTEHVPRKWLVPVVLFVASQAIVFLLFPFKPCTDTQETPQTAIEETLPTEPATEIKDTVQTVEVPPNDKTEVPVKTTEAVQKESPEKTDAPVEKKEVAAEKPAPARKHSQFSKFTAFGDKKVNLDDGKKIICLFAAGCDHCRDAAKEICQLSQNKDFPEVYVLFMDEETFLIDEFFTVAKCRFPHQVVDIPQFWNLLGVGKTTPGVFYLWNGNIIKSFDGIDKNKFNAADLSKALEEK